MPNTFPKHSRLCGQLRIARLYKEGERFVVWPLRVTYKPITDIQSPITNQILVWAPKSLFKRAVKRNRLRRLMREAYRLHQDILQAEPVLQQGGPAGENREALIVPLGKEAGQRSYLIAFNYMDKEEQPFEVIEKALCKALKKIAEK